MTRRDRRATIGSGHSATGRPTFFSSSTLSSNNLLLITPSTRLTGGVFDKSKWFPELSKDELKTVPKIFVGNKIDMRNDRDPNHIQRDPVTLSYLYILDGITNLAAEL
jgi:hypothetical protein